MPRCCSFFYLGAVAVCSWLICTVPTAEAQTDPRVDCTLRLSGAKPLHEFYCSGGHVAAYVGSSKLLKLLGGSTKQQGVKWSADSCGLPPGSCAVAICGSRSNQTGQSAAVILRLELTDLSLGSLGVNNTQPGSWRYRFHHKGDDRVQVLSGLLCIAGDTVAVLQNALVQNNTATGLLISGAARVTISDSIFRANEKKTGPGAAIIAAENASVRIVSSAFSDNKANELYKTQGGAISALYNASVTLQGCSFKGNQAWFGHGGAVRATDTATLRVDDSTFHKHAAFLGAAIAADGVAKVMITRSVFQECWGSFGGALSVAGRANMTLIDTQVLSNYAKDYNHKVAGGGCYIEQAGELQISNTTFWNNSAEVGGAIAVDSERATLVINSSLPLSNISGNTAKEGGGVFTRGVINTMELATKITLRNKATIGDDICTPITNITVLEAPPEFVPLLGDNNGRMPIKVRLSWGDDRPGSGEVQAFLNGRPLVRNLSSPVTGVAVLNVNLQEIPGNYTLLFEVRDPAVVLRTELEVQVVPCAAGQVNMTDVAGGVCNTCPRGSYNLNQTARGCSRCPQHAVCDGAVVIPRPGYWSSSLRSDQPHRCLYPPACAQNTTVVGPVVQQAQQQLWLSSHNSLHQEFLKAQCAQGHEGRLCSRCSMGHGQSMLATIGRCQPCGGRAQIITLYLLAAVATLLLISLLCYLNSVKGTVKQPASSTTPSVSGVHLLLNTVQSSSGSVSAGGALAAAAAGGNPGHCEVANRGQGSTTSQLSSTAGSTVGNCASMTGQALSVTSSTAAVSALDSQARSQLASDLLKCFVIYMQWMLVVATIKVEYPPALSRPFSALSWLFQAGSSATGLDCLLRNESGGLTQSVKKVLINLLAPVAILLTLLLLNALVTLVTWHLWRRRRRWPSALAPNDGPFFRHRGAIARTSIVTMFFFLPSLLRTTYGLFSCVSLDREPPGPTSYLQLHAIGWYWMLDMDQACFEGSHFKWSLGLGIPLLFLLCAVVPFGIIAYVLRCRRKGVLDDPYYATHYGFLYASYKRKCCYWEGVIAMQTCIVMAISVFGATLSAPFQCILLNAAFGLSLLLLAVFKPYAHYAANVMGMQSCACLLLTTQAPLLFALLKSERQDEDTSGPANAVAAVFMLMNVAFVLSVVWRLVRAVNWRNLLVRAQPVLARCGSLCH